MKGLKTKDGYDVEVGMWLQDTSGIYAVIDISYGEVTLHELELEVMGNGCEVWHAIGARYLTYAEVSHMYRS